MSFFSDKFRDAVTISGIPVASIAEQSGISSAMLYKIQSGARLPDSVETLTRLLDILHCSLPLKRTLIQEYLICRIGYHHYSSFQELKAMLSAFTTRPLTAPILSYDPAADIPPVTTGESNVNAVVQQLLDMETRRPGGAIHMFVDLRYQHGFTCLGQSLSRCHEEFGQVRHLFCLKATANDEAILHNMKIFRAVLPQMMTMSHYDPLYCYLPDPNDGTVPFPYFIITSFGVLLLSSSFSSAVFLKDPAIRRQYLREFRLMQENFSPCMEPSEGNMETYFHGFHEIVGRHTPGLTRPVIIAAIPCILPCVSMEAAMRYLPQEMLSDPQVQAISQEYFGGAMIGGYETFFTLEGLEHVIRTGEIMELQGSFVPRARQEDILDAVEEFLRRAKTGLLVPKIFKTNLIPVDTRFSMTLNGKALMLYCEAERRSAVYTNLAETTLSSVVADYVASAKLLGDVYTPQESILLMEKVFRKYRP